MTPNEILNKQFSKTAVGGYRTDDVHTFLANVSDYVTDVLRDQEDLERKLQFLAEKIEEYREDEESLRAALIDAQKRKESMIQGAKKEAAEITDKSQLHADTLLLQAKKEAETLLSNAKLQVDTEAYALNRMQMEVSKFKRQILHMYEKQVDLINVIPFDESKLNTPMPPPEGLFPAEEKTTIVVIETFDDDCSTEQITTILEESSYEEQTQLNLEDLFKEADKEKASKAGAAAKEASYTTEKDETSTDRPQKKGGLRGYQEGFRLDE